MVEELQKYLERANEILTRRFEAEKDWELLQLERQFTETTATIETPTEPKKPKRKTRIEQYIEEHGHSLEPEDLDLLSKGDEVRTKTVADYLGRDGEFGMSDAKVRKLLGNGIKPGKSYRPGGNYKFDTISVVEFVRFGNQTDGKTHQE